MPGRTEPRGPDKTLGKSTVKENAGKASFSGEAQKWDAEVFERPDGSRYTKIGDMPELEFAKNESIISRMEFNKGLMIKAVELWHKQMRKLGVFRHMDMHLSPSVRAVWDAFDFLTQYEIEADDSRGRMKKFWPMLKEIVCAILQNDSAHRWRFQFLMENIDIDKVKLSDADKAWLANQYDFDFRKYLAEQEAAKSA